MVPYALLEKSFLQKKKSLKTHHVKNQLLSRLLGSPKNSNFKDTFTLNFLSNISILQAKNADSTEFFFKDFF